jgi:response regulator RpfG family c-di-GMP phosphodiesterase
MAAVDHPPVLYVDDEQPNLDLFRRRFEEDFEVLTAPGGAQALELLASTEVGVLITDQGMPGMTGTELLARAQSSWPDTSRMLLTAYSDRELLLAAIQQGNVHDYVLKPSNAEDLSLRLRKAADAHLHRRRLARAALERDALRSWKRYPTGLGGFLGDVRWVDAQHAIAVGEAGTTLRFTRP